MNAESPCDALKPSDRGATAQWFGEVPHPARSKVAGSEHLGERHQRRAVARRPLNQRLGAGPIRRGFAWLGNHLDRYDSQRPIRNGFC